ncbi:TPA: DUF551 domain-containing protein [Raoultella ornithinolytica]
MTSKLTITRERLEELAVEDDLYNYPPTQEELNALARMALAAMDSEPVGYFGRFDPDDEDIIDQCSKNVKGSFPLYRHEQPAPVVPETVHSSVIAEQLAHVLYDLDITDHQRAVISCAVDRLNNSAAMLQERQKGAGESNNCRSSEKVQDLQAGKSPAHSGIRPEQRSEPPAQDGNSPVIPDRWIPVSERMPESNGVYFGWDGKRVLEVNFFFGGWSANQFIHGEITHWMPLPSAPQEVK